MSNPTLDSNIIIYSFGDKNNTKKDIAKKVISECNIISQQAINESLFVLHQKLNFKVAELQKIHSFLLEIFLVTELNTLTLTKSLDLMQKYNYSFWDSMMLASALVNKCDTLYSEDMQHKQIIEEKLQIINPFVQ